MELVVVNGANAISRGVISKLAGSKYNKIRLLDFRPYRQSVYAFQRALPQGVTLEKHQVQTLANLDIALEGAQHVVYFTHDYFANSSDKNNFIQATARVAKKQGVEKLVAVCPIEHELYWTEDKSNAIELRNEAQSKALEHNPKMTILNSNLVFGQGSYLIHYLTQCASAGSLSKDIVGNSQFRYKPVSNADLTQAVEHALGHSDEVKGQKFLVNGNQDANMKELLALVEAAVQKQSGSTQLSSNGNLFNLVMEFFTGITHDKNMGLMNTFLNGSSQQVIEDGNADYFQKFGLQHKQGLKEFFGQTKYSDNDLVFPIFTNYKMVSLD